MRIIGKWVMAPIRATAGRVSLQMTGRALISLKVNDANATSTSFDPGPPDPAGFWPVSPDRDRYLGRLPSDEGYNTTSIKRGPRCFIALSSWLANAATVS